MGRRKMVWATTALILAGGYAATLGLVRLAYRSVLYPAPSLGLEQAPPGASLRSFTAEDDVPVHALAFAPHEGRRTIVFFHGNGESIADAVPLGTVLSDRGLGFVAVEYRGYGASRGEPYPGPTEQGLYRDAEAVLGGLRAEGLGPDEVVLWGSSLGSGVAVEMVLRGHTRRLVLSTPYTSIPEVARRLLPVFPMRLLMADQFDNLSKAPRVDVPTLVIHGDADSIVPYDMGVTLSQTIPDAKLLTVPGGGHNDLFLRARNELLDAIEELASRP